MGFVCILWFVCIIILLPQHAVGQVDDPPLEDADPLIAAADERVNRIQSLLKQGQIDQALIIASISGASKLLSSPNRRETHNGDRDSSAAGIKIAVGVALVSTEHQGIAGPESPALAGRDQFDAAALAGEVFARARGVGDAAELAARFELHSGDVEARDRLGHERAQLGSLAFLFRHRSRPKQFGGRPGRPDQLLDRDLERGGGATQDVQGWVGGSGF